MGELVERIKEKVDNINTLSKISCEASALLLEQEQGKVFVKSARHVVNLAVISSADGPIKTCFLWQFACSSDVKSKIMDIAATINKKGREKHGGKADSDSGDGSDGKGYEICAGRGSGNGSS
ncbi:hypothetical protein PspKH34_29780 [Parageobacillus sp. KH3-4]|nr:hypothetical protein PspKH34_29780 [Parageobacillus sp. KH3-4]